MIMQTANPLDPTDTQTVWMKVISDDAGYEKWKARLYEERGMKSREGMLARVKEGWFAGPAPLGYLNDDTHQRAGIILDPVKAPLVREAFELIAAGQRRSVVLKDVTAKGLLTKSNKPLPWTSFELLLHNPFYYGMIRYHGELYPGKHEAIVSAEVFDKVQRSLRSRRKRPTHRKRSASDPTSIYGYATDEGPVGVTKP